MRFTRISIENYRQYQSLQIEFTKGEHDLQIIIGDNGVGKTNLLNAFTWCLYGTEPHLGMNDKDKGEPKLNKETVQAALMEDNRLQMIQVVVEIEQESETARIVRKLPVRVVSQSDIVEKKYEEIFYVQRIPKKGAGSTLEGELAEAYINRILPEGIREYFFFDGEQLGSYFSNKKNGAMKAAIHSISQIDTVTNMKLRTESCVRTLRKTVSKSVPNMQVLEKKLEKNEEIRDSACKQLSDLERQVEAVENRISELNENLRGVPNIAEKERQRRDLQKKIVEYERRVEESRSGYIVFARTAYVDFAFYDFAMAALNAIKEMEKSNQLPPAIDRGYIEEMLSEGVCKVCGRPLSDEDHSHLERVLEQYRVSSETSHILTGMRSELCNLVDRVKNYPVQCDAKIRMLRQAESDLDEAEKTLASIDLEIANFGDSERITKWQEDRALFEKKVRECREQIGAHKRNIQLAEDDCKKAQQGLNIAMHKYSEQKELSDAVGFGDRAAKILESVETAVVNETRTLIASKTEELFKGLVWKDSKCDRIELSETYQLSLYDRAGYSCAGTCSAAERALLALSFTLAMHDVSGFDSPLFIDTPIARASGENRANFANTLVEVSKKKQLILTFTPDEYSEAIASVFDPVAASNMKLVLNAGESSVSVRGN